MGFSMPGRRIAPVYYLIGAVVVAAGALAYYSYRYAGQQATRVEQSIIDTNRDLGRGMVNRIEEIIVDSDKTLFELVSYTDLREFPQRWSDIARFSPAIESVLILDDRLRIVPDGYVSKKRSKEEVDAFRELFEAQILPALRLAELQADQHKHLHQEFEGRYYLISYIKHANYFIVLEADMVYLVSEVLPQQLERLDSLKRFYQVLDSQGRLHFGYSAVPQKYAVALPFAETLYDWRLILAPKEPPTLPRARWLHLVLVILSAMTTFVGLGVLTYGFRAERRANQLKSDFIANVSHELKTPLSLIRMFGELLATGRTKGPEQAREYAEIVTRESERLSRLIDNVLDFARIERGKVAYAFAVGDLAEVLSRGLDVYRYRLEREGMKLHVDVADDLPPVRMDENAMTLVLLNLVDNAVKYAADGKELQVSLAHRDDRIELVVRDRGPGIRADEQERIFERFYRARNVRGRPVRGSGIGLSLVKHIAEAHGGGVSVESTEGKGSAFKVWIPVTTSPEPEGDSLAESAA